MIARALNRFGRAGWGSEEQDGALEAALTDGELLSLRARKFRALSTLFRLDVGEYAAAIDTMLTPCGLVAECPLSADSTTEAGAEARNWTMHVANIGTLHAEHVRLFGGVDYRRQMPSIAACGSMYAEDGPHASLVDIMEFYERYDFTPTGDSACPSYISNELEFMAHLLEEAAHGGEDALDDASDFMVTHLFSWGVVFSAATYARSEHPVTRFAGLMLEHLLFCEAEHARARRRVFELPPPTGMKPA